MIEPTYKAPPLSPDRTFVVQFQEETDVEQRQLLGRVEHVMSGKNRRFQSLEELLEFVRQILKTS